MGDNLPPPRTNAGTIAAIVLAIVFGVALVLAIVFIVMSKETGLDADAIVLDDEPDSRSTKSCASTLASIDTVPSQSQQTNPPFFPATAASPTPAQSPAYSFAAGPARAPVAYYANAEASQSTSTPYSSAMAPAMAPAMAMAAPAQAPSPSPMSFPMPTEGQVSQSAQAKALRKATRARQASERSAASVAKGPGSDASVPASGPAPAAPSGSGKLGSAIATAGGKSLVHMANTKIANTGGMGDFVDDSAASMQLYAPDLKATMDKSLTLSGVSPSFGLDPTQTQLRKQQAIAENMVLSGTVDPSINQVLDASAPFIATSSAIRRAIAAQSSVNNETIIQTPLRFMWQSPLYRPAIPMATMSPITSDLMTPGQAFYLQSIACANGDGPVVQESF